MYAYTFQVVLTVLCGPIFRALYLLAPRLPWSSKLGFRDLIVSSIDIQIVFWESDGFLIFASAVATLVRMNQAPTIFEIAEMQILMFLQLNSLVIMFFCLVHPIARWWQRFFQFLLGFGLATAALSQSRLDRQRGKRLSASQLGMPKPSGVPQDNTDSLSQSRRVCRGRAVCFLLHPSECYRHQSSG